MSDSRRYDIVVFGASGFTGSLVAHYLAEALKRERFRWALAGRDLGKLSAIRDSLPAFEGIDPPDLIEANVEDAVSISVLAGVTKVVITTVGPYALYGEPLLRACAEAGTHYVDLTGEPQFVAAMRDAYDAVARRTGARIVNSCGFESIPPDLGTLFTLRELRRRLGDEAFANASVEVRGCFEGGGGLSGGTWHSAIEAMSTARRWWRLRPKHKPDHVHSLPLRPYYERHLKRWAFPMPTIDPEVVRQSARVRQDYGKEFYYGHYVVNKHLLPLLTGVAGVAGVFSLAQFGFTRQWLLKQRLPGQGPTEEQRARGWFHMDFVAQAADITVVSRVSGGDPGYGDTAKMLAEAALCLAMDRDLPQAAGVITPASAMGEALLSRLEQAGIHFEILA